MTRRCPTCDRLLDACSSCDYEQGGWVEGCAGVVFIVLCFVGFWIGLCG